MEYCALGPLYDLLKKGEVVPPATLVSWAKQIAAGMHYLHTHKIIHRDLKSPNVLIAHDDIVKISDFGTSREWNEVSTKMSFAGTVAWMAPEVIRNEPCSEKVDVWSYGVVLWELLSCEVPYKDVDSSAIIWGVGSNLLQLPIPKGCPDGFRLLVRQCWSARPRNRPSFKHVLMHLDIAAVELLSRPPDEFRHTQAAWREEVRAHMARVRTGGGNAGGGNGGNGGVTPPEELVWRRQEELRHAQEIRQHYEDKLNKTNQLYLELSTVLMQIEQRERQLIKREQQTLGLKTSKKRLNPLFRAHKRRSSLTSPDHNTTSPESPITACTMLNSAQQAETVLCPSPARRSRHRRTGSRTRHSVTLVNSETQTEDVGNRLGPQRVVLRQNEEVLNGNCVQLTYLEREPETQIFTRQESCSSSEMISDGNRNLLTRTVSSDDNLDTLDRAVTAIVNGNLLRQTGGHSTDEPDDGWQDQEVGVLRRRSVARRPIAPSRRNTRRLAQSAASDEENTSEGSMVDGRAKRPAHSAGDSTDSDSEIPHNL